MTPTDAKDGMSVRGAEGVGQLIRAPNGWNVIMPNGTVRQSIDLSQWSEARYSQKPTKVDIKASDRFRTNTEDARHGD
jgi:hypothetical protein